MEKRKLQVDKYNQNKKKKALNTSILLITMLVLAAVSMLIGQYGVSPVKMIKIMLGTCQASTDEIYTISNIMLNIRLPRTISAILIGGALAVAGITYQCVFRNILVSQDVLGVSTGACTGAAIAIILDLSAYYIQGLSFLTGLLSVAVVFLLAKAIKTEKTLSLILSGILVSGLMASVLGYIKYMANPQTHLQSIIFWTMGDLSSIKKEQIAQVAIPIVVCNLLIYVNRWKLNFFCYSDGEASNLGFDIKLYRTVFLVAATILVSTAVSVSGSIGWIGLVIPQLVRTIVGTDNSDTVGVSFIMGANFLLLMDT
ncbi:MAG: iron ABC transporter permease, partial [Lachnospiraceae bacterium]|nr:iron ABC transporter permease [Lachnospiraceae bacterium]